MSSHCQGLNKKQEVRNRSNNLKNIVNSNYPSEFLLKTNKDPFSLLRLERSQTKLELTEESPFFSNIGNAIEEFFEELQYEQDEFYPVMKNEYLFIKEIIESNVEHLKVN